MSDKRVEGNSFVWMYRYAHATKSAFKCDRLRKRWAEWQGEDSLHEMAIGEPLTVAEIADRKRFLIRSLNALKMNWRGWQLSKRVGLRAARVPPSARGLSGHFGPPPRPRIYVQPRELVGKSEFVCKAAAQKKGNDHRKIVPVAPPLTLAE